MAPAKDTKSAAHARAAYLLYKTGGTIGPFIPKPIGYCLACIVSFFSFLLGKARRGQVERNLGRIYGRDLSRRELWRKTLRTFINYGKYWYENFHHNAKSPALARCFQAEGLQNLDRALANGHGVVIALAHLGNWDLGGAYIGQLGYPLTVVMEALEPPELLDWFVSQRGLVGMQVVPLGSEVSTACLQALRQNRLVCLVCDRDIEGNGVPVRFFAEQTSLPAGPALLALRAKSVIIPTAVYRRSNNTFVVEFGEPVTPTRQAKLKQDVARITQEVTNRLESIIRRAPEQWLVMQPNWPSDEAASPEG